MDILNKTSWSIASIWNASLEAEKNNKIQEPRERIWASEIGGAMIDRWLKMKGVQPTNPPNARSRRKFEAGNIWEAIIGHVLNRAGILISKQEWLKFQYPGLLPVTGKLDFLAGGNPDYDRSLHLVQTEFSWLPSFITEATANIITSLKEKYPNGLKEIVLEIKSCSAFMFDVYESKNTGSPHHRCQNFHYLKAKDMQEGHVVYVCRDDARIIEIGVFNPSPIEQVYREDITLMTNYVKNNVEPQKEKPIVFDKDFLKFSANWKVGYSQYLSKLYGLKNQAEFDERYKPITERWNRVLGRVKEGKDMTANNLEAIKEMEEQGFEFEAIKEALKASQNGKEGA